MVSVENNPPTAAVAASCSPGVEIEIIDAVAVAKKKRNLPGIPDPAALVIVLSPKSLLATNRFLCEICNKGFKRDRTFSFIDAATSCLGSSGSGRAMRFENESTSSSACRTSWFSNKLSWDSHVNWILSRIENPKFDETHKNVHKLHSTIEKSQEESYEQVYSGWYWLMNTCTWWWGYFVFHIFIIYKNLQMMTSQISIAVVYLQEHQRDNTSEFRLIGCLNLLSQGNFWHVQILSTLSIPFPKQKKI